MNSSMPRQPGFNADLSQVVAPLASYLCATDRPREALYSALAALFDEMKKTNTAARLHIASVRAKSVGLSSKSSRRSATSKDASKEVPPKNLGTFGVSG